MLGILDGYAEMSEMIERTARYMAETYNGGSWETHYTDQQKDVHRERAKALFALVREPTEAMVEFGDAVRGNHADYRGGNGTANIFRSMIDEARK